MAGVVKVLLALAVLGAAVSLAADPKADAASGRLLWTAFFFSREGRAADVARRRPFNPLLDLDPVSTTRVGGTGRRVCLCASCVDMASTEVRP